VTAAAAAARTFTPMRLLACMAADDAFTPLEGAVLQADLSNFSGLTEALAQRAGPDGADAVGRDLNQALGPVVEAVLRRGGEVVKFSGDGLLCVFPGKASSQAQQAGREIAETTVVGPAGELHRFRVAVVHGSLCLARLGGYRGRMEIVAFGDAVRQAQSLVQMADPGGMRELVLPEGAEPMDLEEGQDSGAWSFLPGWVRERLLSDRSDWLQELRALTVVFVGIDANPVDINVLQQDALAMQAAIDGEGGELMRMGMEGDILVLEATFGLLVRLASTGPREALRCAETVATRIPAARIGLATGRVLLGPIGTGGRRQLTTTGAAVNLAARLMQRAERGQVLVDETTWSAVGGLSGIQAQASLKGLGFRQFWVFAAHAAAAQPQSLFVGRFAQVEAVRALLDEVDQAYERPLVVIGVAGIGKSRFCLWLQDELVQRQVPAWLAIATPVSRDVPYGALRPVLRSLCGLDPATDPNSSLTDLALRILGQGDRAPLLADALGLFESDTDATRVMVGAVRATNILDALIALFLDRDRQGPGVLIMEDAHWLDSASWALLQRLTHQVPRLRVVVVTRPITGPDSPALMALRARRALFLDLPPLEASDIEAVMARHIGVNAVPGLAAKWAAERSGGNPFFAQELATMLVSIGQLEVRDGQVVRALDPSKLSTTPQLSTIEGTLERRIQELGLDDSIALKLASVVGNSFGLDELAALMPRVREGLQAIMGRLVSAGMTQADGPTQFAFRHRYTQEAAYRMLPGDRRRDLHRQIAVWIEDTMAPQGEPRAGELAHHWFAAEERTHAIHWLEKAGMQALRTGADREAVTHFRRVLTLCDGQPPGRQATWRRRLARGLFGLGEVEGVAHEARVATELVVGPLPKTVPGWTLLSVRIAGSRLMGASGLFGLRSRLESDLLEAARAAGLMAESAYFLNTPEIMLGSSLLAVSLAERTPHVAPVSVAYGMLGVVAGMARLHGVAQRYLARARDASQAAGDAYQLGVAWFYTGMYHGCAGDWDASLHAAQQALEQTERLRAYTQSGYQWTLIATNALYTGDYADARAWMATVLARAQASANVQQEGWACNVVSVADLHQCRYADAIERSERGRQIFLQERDLVSLIISEGVQCAAWTQAGRLDLALEAADRSVSLVRQARPTTWGQLEGFAGPCEAFTTAVQQGAVPLAQVHSRLKVALVRLRMFALVFPFGRARLRWIVALLAMAKQRRRTAVAHLHESISLARRYRMPYEELRASQLLCGLVEATDTALLRARVDELQAQLAGAPAASTDLDQASTQAA
jgi:class 3 adenylate cyclase